MSHFDPYIITFMLIHITLYNQPIHIYVHAYILELRNQPNVYSHSSSNNKALKLAPTHSYSYSYTLYGKIRP